MLKVLIASSSLIALVCASAPALAQATGPQAASPDTQAGDQGAADDYTIVVTARRTEERLQDVPIAITAIGGQRLAELGVSTTSDLRSVVAGLNVAPAAGRTDTPTIAIRGQRATDTTVTQGAPVALYMDDIVLTPLAGANLGLFDLDNVQVLKGPQGTLFGRNTTGGAVLFTTAKPTSTLGGYATVGYGNYDSRHLAAAVNLPASDSIRFRAAVDWIKTDGFGEVVAAPSPTGLEFIGVTAPGPAVGRKLQDRDEINARFTAAIDLAPGIETMTTAYYSRAKSGGPAFVVSDPTNPAGPLFTVPPLAFGIAPSQAALARVPNRSVYDTESGIVPGTYARVWGINNTITVELSDTLTFKNIFGYRDVRHTEDTDYDGTIIPLLDSHNITDVHSFSEEAQLQGTAFDEKLNFTTGIYFYRQSGIDTADGTVALFGASTTGGRVVNESFSGYGQIGYKLTDSLNLTAGARYTVDRRKYDLVAGGGFLGALTSCSLVDPAGNPLPLDNCLLVNKATFSKPTWLISLDQKFADGTLVYLASRRGYRAGGFNLRANSNETVGPFRPEVVTDVELGLKRNWDLGGDWHLTSNVAGYYQWYNDVQRNIVRINNGAILNLLVNAAKAHVYGGEAEFELRSGRFFRFNANYAYVKPKYKSFPTSDFVDGIPGVPVDFSDRTFNHIPKHQINSSITLSPDVGTLGELNLTGSVYYQSKVFFSEGYQNRDHIVTTAPPAFKASVPNNLTYGQGGYALVNGRVELNKIAGSNISAAFWVKNLFDKRHLLDGTVFYPVIGFDSLVYGDPRTFGGEVTIKF